MVDNFKRIEPKPVKVDKSDGRHKTREPVVNIFVIRKHDRTHADSQHLAAHVRRQVVFPFPAAQQPTNGGFP